MARLPARRGSTERVEPISYFDDFPAYMNRMMGSFLPSMDVTEQAWTPLADVSENDKEYHVDIEVPGVDRDEIAIEMEGQELTVSGEYRRESHMEGNARHSTRRSGQFEYAVRLPHGVDADKSSAVLEHGVLCLTIPKTTSPGHKKIKIK
ncbi:Hsp20/alpha crystallin family protein [Glycomyces sp. L485]|uniref:Hsp20/alpha crystallin family protein n=1 Tax=Glycomyces sp. L485 TaxID=2909235 RepID=UPI001F4B65D7|nr:Hsp20/alpha crystallin family protein [Glycomyces sp. L485]MCH7231384.1 Hsp20/alpha crystallin family protein [Glycomyces sp. L485]